MKRLLEDAAIFTGTCLVRYMYVDGTIGSFPAIAEFQLQEEWTRLSVYDRQMPIMIEEGGIVSLQCLLDDVKPDFFQSQWMTSVQIKAGSDINGPHVLTMYGCRRTGESYMSRKMADGCWALWAKFDIHFMTTVAPTNANNRSSERAWYFKPT